MPPLIVLHGFLGQPSHWDTVLSLSHRDVHRVTLPGHGPHPWTLPDADFDAVVDAMLARPPFSVVPPPWALAGYSLGGRLALSVAARHPDRVAALLLASASPGLTDPTARAERARADDALARELVTHGLTAFVSRWEALPLFASQSSLPEDLRALHRAHRLNHHPEAVAWALSTLSPGRMPPRHDALRSLAIPVHLVTGERDAAYTALARASGRDHTVIPDAGHDVVLEAPAAVARALGSLLAPLDLP